MRLASAQNVADHRVVITIDDQIDVGAVPDLRWQMHDLILAGARTIVVELGPSATLGSNAVAALLGAHRACRGRGGGVILRNPNRQVSDLMYRTGLWRVFAIELPRSVPTKEA